jgi:hypothetical protein
LAEDVVAVGDPERAGQVVLLTNRSTVQKSALRSG